MTESTKRDFSWDDAFPERWLHADDLRDEAGHLRDVTLTITDVYKEQLRIPGSRPSDAYVVSFASTKREYVLNKTNARFLRANFGKKSGTAIGHKVTLHPVTDESGKSNSGYRILFIDPPAATTKPPANVDPVTGEVGDDDIGFGDDAPYPPEDDTEAPSSASGAESDAGAADGTIPGRGAKSAQGELA